MHKRQRSAAIDSEAGEFIVTKIETVVQQMTVFAENPAAARTIVEAGGGTFFREKDRRMAAETVAKLTPVAPV